MNLSDTPNPNAKKLIISHDNKVGEYLDINNTNTKSVEYSILSIVGIESVFAGPGFLTILKKKILIGNRFLKRLILFLINYRYGNF